MTLHVTPTTRLPYQIAQDIERDYREKGKPVYFGAVPYVHALKTLSSWQETYYADDAESVLTYMLSNLSTWRGDKAREVKAECKAILGRK